MKEVYVTIYTKKDGKIELNCLERLALEGRGYIFHRYTSSD